MRTGTSGRGGPTAAGRCGARRNCATSRRTRGAPRADAQALSKCDVSMFAAPRPPGTRPTHRLCWHAMVTTGNSNLAGDVTGDRCGCAFTVGRQQHVAAQVEQPRHLVAPIDGFLGARTGRGRQVAGDDRHDEKRDQRHPIVRVRDREGPDRRHEEEVERQHGRDRRADGHGQRRRGCGEEDDQEVREGDRGRRDHAERVQRHRGERDGRQRGGEVQRDGTVAHSAHPSPEAHRSSPKCTRMAHLGPRESNRDRTGPDLSGPVASASVTRALALRRTAVPVPRLRPRPRGPALRRALEPHTAPRDDDVALHAGWRRSTEFRGNGTAWIARPTARAVGAASR